MSDKYWEDNEGCAHLVPPGGKEFPEGFDPRTVLAELIGSKEKVVEVGCGDGRLCKAFAPDKYIGVDINQKAIDRGRKNNPDYVFNLCHPTGEDIPDGDTLLFYTVLLHMSDGKLEEYLKRVTKKFKKVVVCEILGREWRRDGNPPVYNREEKEYIGIFSRLGLPYKRSQWKLYERYEDWDAENKDITFTVFERER